MSKRHYVCAQCGSLRRRPAVYAKSGHKELPDWPRCCDTPMEVLSFVQAEGATKLADEQRVEWIAKGMHVLRRDGKHRWRPAFNEREIEEAKAQKDPLSVRPRC